MKTNKTKNKKVKINRKKWLRGMKDGDKKKKCPVLLNDEGQRCCLGFAICQIGKIKKDKILEELTPQDLDFQVSPFSYRDENYIENSKFTKECMGINDDEYINEKQREYKLRRKFKSKGIDLEFYG